MSSAQPADGLPKVALGPLRVSRLIVGGNPFSGISHQSGEKNDEMRDYFTAAKIKETLGECEAHGIDTFLGRCDNHICRLLREHRNEGGRIQWIAQTAPERASVEQNIEQAAFYGARGCYLQGSQTQTMWEAGEVDRIARLLDLIRGRGMAAGVACHVPEILLDLDGRGLKPDFYLMCFYNLTGHRGNLVRHAEGEAYPASDRDAATEAIRRLAQPAIGYKILAAGRNDPAEAFGYAFRNIRPTDAVCVGIYTKHQRDQVAVDVRLAMEAIRRAEDGKGRPA